MFEKKIDLNANSLPVSAVLEQALKQFLQFPEAFLHQNLLPFLKHLL